MNKKLEAIADLASIDLKAFIKEGEDKILEAWSAAEAEAELEETKPKFKLGFAISLDLDKDKMETKLTFGVKHTLSKDANIPNPDQLTLPVEPTVRIKSGNMDTGDVPVSGFKKAVEEIRAGHKTK